MKKIKRAALASSLVAVLFALSGCVQTYHSGAKAGQPTGEGWLYNYFVKPVGEFITFLVQHFDWNYGVAIIVVTILFRTLILPLGLYQSHKMAVQQEKMAHLKPQLDIVQAKLKEAKTKEEQMAANMEMQAVYRENNVSMFGGIGCLPLLIQMPIFTALFYAAKYTQGISTATFLGVSLGKSSLIFTVIAGLSYLLQSYVSMLGVPEEQRKMMRSTMIISPLMIMFLSFSSPGGVALYWIVGGFYGVIQTLITTFYHKPRIKKKIAEEMKKNPVKQVVSANPAPVKQADPSKPTSTVKATPNKNGRNAGKQKRN